MVLKTQVGVQLLLQKATQKTEKTPWFPNWEKMERWLCDLAGQDKADRYKTSSQENKLTWILLKLRSFLTICSPREGRDEGQRPSFTQWVFPGMVKHIPHLYLQPQMSILAQIPPPFVGLSTSRHFLDVLPHCSLWEGTDLATASLVLSFALPKWPTIPLLTSSIEPSWSYQAALSHGKLGGKIASGHISVDNLHPDFGGFLCLEWQTQWQLVWAFLQDHLTE